MATVVCTNPKDLAIIFHLGLCIHLLSAATETDIAHSTNLRFKLILKCIINNSAISILTDRELPFIIPNIVPTGSIRVGLNNFRNKSKTTLFFFYIMVSHGI